MTVILCMFMCLLTDFILFTVFINCAIFMTVVSESGVWNAFPAVCFDQSLKIFQKDIARSNSVWQRLRGSYLHATILRIAWMLTEAA